MMLSEDVADYLIAANIANVFYSFLPDDSSSAVCVYDSSSPISQLVAYPAGIQVIVRNPNKETAYATAVQVRNLLHNKSYFLSHFNIVWSKALQDVLFLGEDEKGRSEYSINFSLTKKL